MTNATILGNGVSGYATSTSGTTTNYIRADALTTYIDPVLGTDGQSELAYIDTAAGIAAGSGTEVTNVVVTDGGSGYLVAPTISFTGGGGTLAAATAFIEAGTIVEIVVTDGGSGYSSAPTVVVTPASGDPGTGGTGTAHIQTGAITLEAYLQTQIYPLTNQNAWTRFSGYVLSFNTAAPVPQVENQGVVSYVVTDGGSGYTSVPGVVITSADGNGSGATATAVLTSEALTSITVTATGSGYTAVPTISFSGGGGTLAAATAVLGYPTWTTTAQLATAVGNLAALVNQLVAQSDLAGRSYNGNPNV